MPNRDGTGPEGEGPRTGRGAGECEGAIPTQVLGRRRQGRNRRN